SVNTIGLYLFEGLSSIDASGAVVPGVSQAWEHKAPDTWIFKLRRDAKWSNGQPVTASEFVYAWLRLADPTTGAKYTMV
ncbi:ABC transporter substrate-binding protein, partial [Burkholderia pseudomallei]